MAYEGQKGPCIISKVQFIYGVSVRKWVLYFADSPLKLSGFFTVCLQLTKKNHPIEYSESRAMLGGYL